LPTATGV